MNKLSQENIKDIFAIFRNNGKKYIFGHLLIEESTGWKLKKNLETHYSLVNKYDEVMVAITKTDSGVKQYDSITEENYKDIIGFINYFNLQDKLDTKSQLTNKLVKI